MSTLERALEAGLRIRPGEQRRVAIMAAYAANAIGAVVVGRSLRDALYLAAKTSTGGAAKGLAGMYVYSSLAIVLVSWMYSRVADKADRGLLNAACALMCASLCAGFWALMHFSSATWIYAALYIFVEAMGSLVVIQFWTMANDVFHAREAKRLFGLIGGGGTLANVIFGLLVGKYAKTIGAVNLLWLMVGAAHPLRRARARGFEAGERRAGVRAAGAADPEGDAALARRALVPAQQAPRHRGAHRRGERGRGHHRRLPVQALGRGGAATRTSWPDTSAASTASAAAWRWRSRSGSPAACSSATESSPPCCRCRWDSH